MKIFKYLSILLITTFLTTEIKAQNFTDLHFGTDYTLDIVSWNTEWFPTNGVTTVDFVAEIVEALDVEIIAFQEMGDKYYLQQLIDALDDYEGYYIEYDDYQSLAYIYHKDKIDILDNYEIFVNDWSEFPRSPLILEFRFENKDYIVINNHLKCCDEGVDRRYRACNMLNNYIDYYMKNDRVILLGDLNDELTDSNDNNVFRNLLNNDEYLFVDMDIAEGSSSNWSYPTWPSHLDHIMITNELFDVFNEEESSCETIKVDEYFPSWNSYEYNVSDHRPVGLKLQTKEIGLEEISQNLIKTYPNPFEDSFNFSFEDDYDLVKVYNSSGSMIFESKFTNYIDSSNWPSGLYTIRLLKKEKVVSTQKVIRL